MYDCKTKFRQIINTWDDPEQKSSITDSISLVQDAWNSDEDSLPPIKLQGYFENTRNRLLSSDMCEEIRTLIPSRIQLYTNWTLLYSLEQHGASLHSLYDHVSPNNTTNSRVGYVLVIKDKKGGIFGAYANEFFHPSENRRYYGNGECFLWKMDKVPNIIMSLDNENQHNHGSICNHEWQFKGYPFTGINEFCIYCTSTFLSMGAGNGNYGLWCDDSLSYGVSDPCPTFGNEILSKESSKFHIIGLEAWRVG